MSKARERENVGCELGCVCDGIEQRGKGGGAERGGGRAGWRRPVARHWLRAGRLMTVEDVRVREKRHVIHDDLRNDGHLPPSS